MAGAARLNDTIFGEFTEEHHNHYTPAGPMHPSGVLNGVIKHGCSNNVYINGLNAAIIGSTTDDDDICCDYEGVVMHSTISNGSSKVFINNIGAARIGDNITVHCAGIASVSSGSNKVFIG